MASAPSSLGQLRTEFNLGHGLPQVLNLTIHLWRSLEDALRACRPSALVTPAPGCAPI